MLIESAEISFEDFLCYNNTVTGIAPEAILRIAYSEIFRIVFNTEWDELDTDFLAGQVNSRLAEEHLACLHVVDIITALMEYFSQFTNVRTASLFEHQDRVKKIVWAVIARYMHPGRELPELLSTRIMEEFDAVNYVFDFLINEGMLGI